MLQDAAVYTSAVRAATQSGVLCGPASGSVFTSLPEVADGSSLALVLLFDALSVAKNALGAAATCSKKFYILCMRVVNVPYLLRKKTFLLPVCVVPKKTVDHVGFRPMFEHLRESLEHLSSGTHVYAYAITSSVFTRSFCC